MSPCLSGGAAYCFDLETMKSPPSRTASHNTPSPSSTISESNSPPPLSISTRKPRTRRKRPNETYDEAASLLSTAYPNIFSSKNKTPSNQNPLFLSDYDEASHFLLPLEPNEETGFLFNLTVQTKPDHFFDHKEVNSEIIVSDANRFDDFDAGSILDEEVEEGIDSFMGNIEINDRDCHRISRLREIMKVPWNRSYHLGLGLKSALRENDNASWCGFSTVEFEQISPRIQTETTAAAVKDGGSNAVGSNKIVTADRDVKKKKMKKKVAPAAAAELKSSEDKYSSSKAEQRGGPLLKLDYDGILEVWADKESPLSAYILGTDDGGIDVYARLGEIDLFGESGMREAIVSRYKEKRRNRLFSNSQKIRYQVRKLNADQRPRKKGRFVRRPNVRNLSGLRL